MMRICTITLMTLQPLAQVSLSLSLTHPCILTLLSLPHVHTGPDEPDPSVNGRELQSCFSGYTAFCIRIRQSWFVTEAYALFKLALPIVSLHRSQQQAKIFILLHFCSSVSDVFLPTIIVFCECTICGTLL